MPLKIDMGINGDPNMIMSYITSPRLKQCLYSVGMYKAALEGLKPYIQKRTPVIFGDGSDICTVIHSTTEGYVGFTYNRKNNILTGVSVVVESDMFPGTHMSYPIFTMEQADSADFDELISSAAILKFEKLVRKALDDNDVSIDDITNAFTYQCDHLIHLTRKLNSGIETHFKHDDRFDSEVELYIDRYIPNADSYFISSLNTSYGEVTILPVFKPTELYAVFLVTYDSINDEFKFTMIDLDTISFIIRNIRKAIPGYAMESTVEMIPKEIYNTPIGYAMESMMVDLHTTNKLMVEGFTANPYMELHNVERKNYTDDDAYISECIDIFLEAFDKTNGDVDLLMEAIVCEDAVGAAHKMVNAGKDVAGKVAKTATNVKKATEMVTAPIFKSIENVFNSIQKNREDESREIAISNSIFLKLRRIFKYCIAPAYVATVLYGPAVAICTGLVGLVVKSNDDEAKRQVVSELEMELKLTREKIDDAKNHGETTKKYELMRIESKIESELGRIKFGSKN